MRTWIAHLAAVVVAVATAQAQGAAPQPASPVPSIPVPRDRPYPGTITLAVDASDTARNVIAVHEVVPVRGTRDLILLYPEWVPGDHAPTGRQLLDRLAGVTVSAGGSRLPWSRDPVNVFAFHVAVPAGISAVSVDYQYLGPPSGDYGTPQMTTDLLTLDWNTVVLYPAGYFARQITFQPRITLPAGWQMASALARRSGGPSGEVAFEPVALDTLIDSPLYAGRYVATLDLAPGEPVAARLNLFADRPEQLAVDAAQLAGHRALVQQAYRLFGSRHYDHYDFLVSLSAAIPAAGTEHHRSSFDGLYANFFSEWDKGVNARDLLAHEYVHSWNGKFRRPADLWTPNYNVPMRNSLLWVYEGMTQYWGDVLTARAGLRSHDQALDVLALLIARYQYEPGRDWRSLQDTTNEPIIRFGGSQPWSTWQRGTDYYRVSQLIWLDADTLIRERSGGRNSLDDLARQFFGIEDGSFGEVTYTFDDVVAALTRVLPYDWAGFLRTRLDAIGGDLPLDGVTRGGYRLIFTDTPSEVYRLTDERNKVTTLTYSIGVSVDKDGKLQSVLWNGPAWRSGLAPGTQLLAVNGFAYDVDLLKSAIRAGIGSNEPLELIVREGARFRTVRIDYHGGLRYPHLVRDASRAALLDQILAPRS